MKTISDIKNSCVSLFNEKQCVASESLIEAIINKNVECDTFINLAYTDYGGTFLEKVFIQYMKEFHSESIEIENTSWYGDNAIIFGDIVNEIIEATNNYLLGFEDIEEYYIQKEDEERTKAADLYITDNNITNEGQIAIVNKFFEEQAVYTFGVDYSENELNELLNI